MNFKKINLSKLSKIKLSDIRISRFKGWMLPIIAAVGFVFSLIFVLARPSTPVKEPLVSPPISVYEQTIAGIGIVEPKSELIAIGVELPGIAREVYVKVGDSVKKGDPLFALDQRDVDAQIKTLQANLETAKIMAEDASAQFAIVSGVEDRRAVAKDDYNRRKFGKQSAFSRIEEIKADLERALTTKERQTIRAPLDGRILKVDIRKGEYASAGALVNPLMLMGDISRLHVRVEIDEENIHLVDPKNGATGYRRGDTARPIPLTFVRFEPHVLPKQNLAVAGQRVDTRVLQVIYALPTTHDTSFVGQQMDVFIEQKLKKEAKDHP